MASFYASGPAGAAGGSNPSVGTNGIGAPASSTEVGFIDGSGNLQGVSPTNPLPVTIDGGLANPLNVNVANIAGTATTVGAGASTAGTQRVILSSDSPLPTGASTSALQTTGNTTLGSILLDLTNGTQITQVTGTVPLPTGASTSALQSNVQSAPGTPQTVALTIQGNASGVAVPVSGTVTVTPSGEQNVNLNQVGGSAIAIGQQLSAASLPVVLPATQITALTPPTTVNVTQATAANLNATVAQSGTWNITNVSGTVSLPTGASTSALQTTGNTSLASIATAMTNNTQTSQLVSSAGYGAQVSASGALSTTITPNNVFNDPFDGTVFDVTNRWNAPVTAGAGAVTQTGGGLNLSVGTGANSAVAISSQPTFMTQTGTQLPVGFTLQLEGTIATGSYRFFGYGTAGTTYSTSDPIKDGIGFEITTAGVLRAVVYNSDSLVFSQNLTVPTDNAYHLYFLTPQGNVCFWYLDNTQTPIATASEILPGNSLLPIRMAILNGASTTTGTPIMNSLALGIVDIGRNATVLSDGTYQWRKATVNSSGQLSVLANAPTLPTVPLFGHQTSTGTAVALGSGALVNGAIIQALAGNAGNVYIGGSAVTTGTGFQLQPGQATSAAVSNLSALYVIAATSGDGVCYIGS